jgi:predicted acyltransferase
MSQPITADLTERPARLVSLDAFRGLTIAGMILVNNAGTGAHVYPPLRHAAWDGWTPTDLVFPSFLFIVGVAIPLALGKRLGRGDAPGAIVAKVVRRSLLIFALGLFLNVFPFDKPPTHWRIPGVLQRIALCYLAAALIYLGTGLRAQVATVVALLLGYWAAMTLIPVPGVGAGDLSRPNNLAAWVDRLLLPGHLYKSDYDPEGLLSTLPAIATTLLGVLAGRWLATARPVGERVAGLFAAGAVALFAGSVWGHWFPINKALWTSSYTLLMAGLSLQVLALCAFVIEVEGYRRWSLPLLVFGSNPIAAYVLSSFVARVLTMVKVGGAGTDSMSLKEWVYRNVFASWADPTFASMLYGLSYVALWLALMAVLYRMKVFIRV